MRIVDAHVHIWRAVSDYPVPNATIISSYSDVPVELLDDYRAEHGIERAVLVQPLFPGQDNSYVADCAAVRPDQYAAVCVVDPLSADAPERLTYWVRERGCKGLRLRPMMASEAAAFAAPHSLKLWERAAALGVVINIVARPQHLATLHERAAQFPTVPIIVDHIAHPDPRAVVDSADFQAVLALAQFPNVFIKPTGYYYYSQERYPYADCWPLFHAVYAHFGAARLIWGSDFPHVLLKTGYARSLHMQERVYTDLPAADLEAIMGGNALRLYWG